MIIQNSVLVKFNERVFLILFLKMEREGGRLT